MNKKRNLPTSLFLHRVIKKNNTDRITINELKLSLHEKGFNILMIFFVLPVSIPMPYIPGITTIFSIPLVMFSLQMLFGFDTPWLPQWINRRSIDRSILKFVVTKSSPVLYNIEKFLKPRFLVFSTSKASVKLMGFFTLMFAISIALPLPLTNFVPAWGILIMSLGALNRDGIVMLTGILLGMSGVILTLSILILGKKIVLGVFHSLIK